jgi:hypothetical protein
MPHAAMLAPARATHHCNTGLLLLLLLLLHCSLVWIADNVRSVGLLLSVSWNPKLVNLKVWAQPLCYVGNMLQFFSLNYGSSTRTEMLALRLQASCCCIQHTGHLWLSQVTNQQVDAVRTAAATVLAALCPWQGLGNVQSIGQDLINQSGAMQS